MRVLAGALLALAAAPVPSGSGSLAVSLESRPGIRACTIVSTATIIAYEGGSARTVEVAYRFARSDGTFSRTTRIALSGHGNVAQSVRDEWSPRGASRWIALEIVAPEHLRTQQPVVSPRCTRGVIAASRVVR